MTAPEPYTDDELAYERARIAEGYPIEPTVLPHRLLDTVDAERALRQQAETERDDLASQLAAIRRRATEHPKGLSAGYVLAVMDTPAAPGSGTPGEDTDTPAEPVCTTCGGTRTTVHGLHKGAAVYGPCPDCRPVGDLPCRECQGIGSTWVEGMPEMVCSTCKGTGKRPVGDLPGDTGNPS